MIEIDSHLVLVECIECFRFSLINAVDSDSGYFETQGFEERVEFYQFWLYVDTLRDQEDETKRRECWADLDLEKSLSHFVLNVWQEIAQALFCLFL